MSDIEPRRVEGWAEEDAYTGWRKYYAWRPGALKWVKRHTHKRERRERQADIKKRLRDE